MSSAATSPARAATVAPAPAALRAGSRKVVLDMAIQVVGRLGNLALGVVVTALLARSLGDSGFGDWATLGAATGLAGTLSDLGFTQVAVRKAAEEPHEEARWLGALMWVRIPLTLVSAALAVGIAAGISTSGTMLAAGIVMSIPILLNGPSALGVVFQLRLRNWVQVAIISVRSVAWGAIVLVLYLTHGSLLAFAGGQTVVLVAGALLMAVLAARSARIQLRAVREACLALVKVGVPLAIGGLFVLGYARIDQILFFQIAGDRAVGFGGAAYRLFDQSIFFPASIATTLFPLLAAAARTNAARFQTLLQSGLELLLAGSAGALAVSIAYAGPIVRFLYGSGFERAAPALPILMGAFVLVSVGHVQDMLVVITGQQKRFMAVAAAAFALNVALNVALIPVWGFIASAVITGATEAVVVVLRWVIVRNQLPAAARLGRIPRVLAAACGLLALLLALRAGDVSLGPALAAAVVGYLALLLGLRAIRPDEVRALLGRERAA